MQRRRRARRGPQPASERFHLIAERVADLREPADADELLEHAVRRDDATRGDERVAAHCKVRVEYGSNSPARRRSSGSAVSLTPCSHASPCDDSPVMPPTFNR